MQNLINENWKQEKQLIEKAWDDRTLVQDPNTCNGQVFL